jgi:hypothetical protein
METIDCIKKYCQTFKSDLKKFCKIFLPEVFSAKLLLSYIFLVVQPFGRVGTALRGK